MKIISAVAASVLSFFWMAAADAETVKIGVVLPYSGPNSDLGNQVDKAFDLYIKLHAKDFGDNKIELDKTRRRSSIGSECRTVVTELITNDKVRLFAGFVFSPASNRRRAACDAGKDADDHRQCWNSVDHHSVALYRSFFFQHVGSRLPDGHLRSEKLEL